MDYEKKYKESLEKARQLCAYPTTKPFISDLQDLFPELKESEDEKIRKELIRAFKSLNTIKVWNGIERTDILAWLERLNEKLPSGFYHVNSEGKKFYSDTFKYGGMILHAEKQDKQKSTDVEEVNFFDDFRKTDSEDEPKFHEGEWVVRGNTIAQILDIQEQYYVGLDINGKDFTSSRFLNGDKIHLWIIQDAKPGDVLCGGTTIFIFKDLLSDGSVMSYCDYDANSGESNAFCPLSVNLVCSKITPAAKEQRDLLFQKMNEAGYEWDAEKKELNKIEQSPIDVRTTGYLHVEDVEQNLTWSEEDKQAIEDAESWLDMLCEYLKNNSSQYIPVVKEVISKLKSLRPQNKWKPSKEQLNALHDAVVYVDKSMFPYPKEILMKLYKQLKKLREE